MAMGGEGSIIDRLKQLNLVPTALSYEYDPCDFLKAQEFQQKRDIEGFKKSPKDADRDFRIQRADMLPRGRPAERLAGHIAR